MKTQTRTYDGRGANVGVTTTYDCDGRGCSNTLVIGTDGVCPDHKWRAIRVTLQGVGNVSAQPTVTDPGVIKSGYVCSEKCAHDFFETMFIA